MSNTYENIVNQQKYSTTIPSGSHWSLMVRKGTQMTITDTRGGANVAMLMYNPIQLMERYNAPDTLKCQHTFKLTKGNCLYSDMGRIFCSIVEDSFGWHDTVCGNSHASHVEAQWGKRDYQNSRNAWHQNGYDSFLVELGKYHLTKKDMAANVNWFSKVTTDESGDLSLTETGKKGDSVTLRFEMDTLVVMHTCPHPLNSSETYPVSPIQVELKKAPKMESDDVCFNHCDENKRGYENNALYHFGMSA